MLKLVDLRGFRGDPLARLPRARLDLDDVREKVRSTIRAVRSDGDGALRDLTARYDGVRLDDPRITPEEMERAAGALAPSLRDALGAAAERVRAYHERQAAEERALWWRTDDPGLVVGEETRPLRRVGCYVPGGRAAYPSTVFMTTIPAHVAGVEEIVVCVPPQPDGTVHPVTLAALSLAGVREAYRVGGAQAVAAMAYGTESVARVDKIVGPGSVWVAVAKHEVAMDVGVDGFAGPTEICIVADAGADPRFVAADLIAQAEHDPLAACVLLTPATDLVEPVLDALASELETTVRREIVEAALGDHGYIGLTDDVAHAVEIADAYAPEHLELVVEDAGSWIPRVRNAGAVFCGPYSAVALGDYIAGTNHVLPTAGTGRFASPLRASDFVKSTAIVSFDRTGVEKVGPALIEIAREEGLAAHARAIEIRLEG